MSFVENFINDLALNIIEQDAKAHETLAGTSYTVRIGSASRALIADDTHTLREKVKAKLGVMNEKQIEALLERYGGWDQWKD